MMAYEMIDGLECCCIPPYLTFSISFDENICTERYAFYFFSLPVF